METKFENWELELGIAPALLLGIRSYNYIDEITYTLYFGCFYINFTRY